MSGGRSGRNPMEMRSTWLCILEKTLRFLDGEALADTRGPFFVERDDAVVLGVLPGWATPSSPHPPEALRRRASRPQTDSGWT